MGHDRNLVLYFGATNKVWQSFQLIVPARLIIPRLSQTYFRCSATPKKQSEQRRLFGLLGLQLELLRRNGNGWQARARCLLSSSPTNIVSKKKRSTRIRDVDYLFTSRSWHWEVCPSHSSAARRHIMIDGDSLKSRIPWSPNYTRVLVRKQTREQLDPLDHPIAKGFVPLCGLAAKNIRAKHKCSRAVKVAKESKHTMLPTFDPFRWKKPKFQTRWKKVTHRNATNV